MRIRNRQKHHRGSHKAGDLVEIIGGRNSLSNNKGVGLVIREWEVNPDAFVVVFWIKVNSEEVIQKALLRRIPDISHVKSLK